MQPDDFSSAVDEDFKEFLRAAGAQFDLALERIEDLWQDDLTVDAVTRLVNEAAVNLGVFVSVVELSDGDWEEPFHEDLDDIDWHDGFVSHLFTIAAAASIGVRLTASPDFTDHLAAAWCFALVPGQLDNISTSDPVKLHLFVLNAVGKLMRQQRLLDAARMDDEAAIAELVELNGSILEATRSLMLLFMVVAGTALAAAYRLRPEDPRYIAALDEPLARPPVKLL